MPEFAVPLDRSVYAVADGLDRVLLYHFAVKWWKFLMPVHDLGSSVSRRTHGDILLRHKGGESISVTDNNLVMRFLPFLNSLDGCALALQKRNCSAIPFRVAVTIGKIVMPACAPELPARYRVTVFCRKLSTIIPMPSPGSPP
jgi:hypothetical protein